MDHWARTCCLAFISVLLFIKPVAGQGSSPRFNKLLVPYGNSKIDLSKEYPDEFNRLYEKVKGHLSRQELRIVLSKKIGIEMDDFHMDRIKFIASPRSLKLQEQEHIDWIPQLVNDETLAKGVKFFSEYQKTLRQAYEETGVKPQDIIAILNWESKLGERKGKYDVFKIFVGQIFYIDEVEKRLYEDGAYNEEEAMPRNQALERIKKVKRLAINNLGELLIQAKQRGFDPYALKGSWAGAIGLPQFMPASMLYAADGNGDGIIDLNTVEDAIMSVGNYLMKHHYHSKGAEYSFQRYNPEDQYVRGVALYSQEIENRGVKTPPNWIFKNRK